jgi:hypothetical protein
MVVEEVEVILMLQLLEALVEVLYLVEVVVEVVVV